MELILVTSNASSRVGYASKLFNTTKTGNYIIIQLLDLQLQSSRNLFIMGVPSCI